MKSLYANIAIDAHVEGLFTYIVPDYLAGDIKTGSRVLVPFGNRTLTGYVISFKDTSDVDNLKSVHSVLDAEPFLNQEMIDFSKWISEI